MPIAVSARRHVVFYALSVIVLAGMGYLIFELGRFQAGYSLLDERRAQQELRAIIGQQEEEVEELRRQLTVLETSREIDQETYAQVEDDLSQLQIRIQAQEEELAFYQGIISPEDGQPGLRVQSLNLTEGEAERHYLMRLVLVQAISQERRVSGVVRVNIEGVRDGETQTLRPGEVLVEHESDDIPFAFRYFQGLQRELVLPDGFEPSRIIVEIRPEGSPRQRILHNYNWVAATG